MRSSHDALVELYRIIVADTSLSVVSSSRARPSREHTLRAHIYAARHPRGQTRRTLYARGIKKRPLALTACAKQPCGHNANSHNRARPRCRKRSEHEGWVKYIEQTQPTHHPRAAVRLGPFPPRPPPHPLFFSLSPPPCFPTLSLRARRGDGWSRGVRRVTRRALTGASVAAVLETDGILPGTRPRPTPTRSQPSAWPDLACDSQACCGRRGTATTSLGGDVYDLSSVTVLFATANSVLHTSAAFPSVISSRMPTNVYCVPSSSLTVPA